MQNGKSESERCVGNAVKGIRLTLNECMLKKIIKRVRTFSDFTANLLIIETVW